MAKVERNSCFELLRICCMMMIIAGHIIMKHHAQFSLSNVDWTLDMLLRGANAVAVNAFILISGYFGIHFKWERLMRMDMQVVFYSVLLLLVSILLGWHTFNLQRDFLMFFPVLSKQYWFITCYVVLYLISPLLNRWSESMEKKEYKRILIVGAMIIYINFLVNANQFINDAGYGIVNFAYLYMLGRYIRNHYEDKRMAAYYWRGYFLTVLLLFACQYGLSWILGFEFTSWISYNTIFVFVGAICLFMAFKNMTFTSRIVNYWAKPCLAVYLIHLHPCIWSGFCSAIGVSDYHGKEFLLMIFVLPILIYVACASLEIVREKVMIRIEVRVISVIRNHSHLS